MGAVAPPNAGLPSACMSNIAGCQFLNGAHEPHGRCDHVQEQYICCVFRCEDAECHGP